MIAKTGSLLAHKTCRNDRHHNPVTDQVTNSSLKRALASVGWSKKVARQRAKEQNADLRDFYLHKISDFKSYHLVYVDESGCDKRIGFRRTGWSPLGMTPLQISHFHRDQRYQILPVYAQDGIVLSCGAESSDRTFTREINHVKIPGTLAL